MMGHRMEKNLPKGVICVATIIAEGTAQVLVQNTITLFTPAQKIDEVQVSVRDLRCFIIPNKVIFQGVLHKQIFFVNLDQTSVHQGADLPFSGFLDLPGVVPGQCCTLTPTVVFVEDTLSSPTTLQETVVVDVAIQVTAGPCPMCTCSCQQNNIRVFTGNCRSFASRGRGTVRFSTNCC